MQLKRRTRNNTRQKERKLQFESLQARELFYAPPMTPVEPPAETPTQQSNPDVTKDSRFHLFPRGKEFNSTRFTPVPQGLFPDGSVQSMSPTISPRGYQHLVDNGKAPIRSTLHRPGVGYGAPTATLAGMNPKIRELTTMQENWDKAHGHVVQCTQRIEIAPENAAIDIDTIYRWMEDFRLFNDGNIATVQVYKPGPFEFPLPEGESYAVFTVNTLDNSHGDDPYWEMLNTLQLLINDRDIAVKLHSDPEKHQLAAVTLENHMLVGVRVWRIYENELGWIRIETESREQRNGVINNMAAEMAARSAMEEVWLRYLKNLGHAITKGSGHYSTSPAQWTQYPKGIENPWKDVKNIPLPVISPPENGFPQLKITR